MRPYPSCLALITAGLLVAAGPTVARTVDREQPADIEAGHFADDPETGQRIFSGGVVLRQGTLEIQADQATLTTNDAGELVKVLLTGAPATWAEDLDDGSRLEAEAERIDYAFEDEKVVLEGDVTVDRGTDRIMGDVIRYDLGTSRLDAGGGEGRVEMRITPRRKPPAGADEGP